MQLIRLSLPFVGIALAGCAHQPPVPDAQLAVAQAAVGDAQRAGAAEVAPVELSSAQKSLALAQSAVREERYDQARRHAEIAAVDAKLAETRARSARAQRAAQELQASVDVLRSELERRADTPSLAPGGAR